MEQVKIFKQHWTIEKRFSDGMIEIKAVKANKAGWRRMIKIFPEVYLTISKSLSI